MSNEAVILELLGNGGDPINFTCADGTGIAKGAVLELTDARTVITCSAVDKPIAGIAAAEKVASDGATTIAVYTNGIFDMDIVAGGTSVLGADVVSAGAGNEIDDFDTLDGENGYVIGKSLETGAASEKVAIRVLK